MHLFQGNKDYFGDLFEVTRGMWNFDKNIQKLDKLTSIFHASVLLLIMNFVITLSK